MTLAELYPTMNVAKLIDASLPGGLEARLDGLHQELITDYDTFKKNAYESNEVLSVRNKLSGDSFKNNIESIKVEIKDLKSVSQRNYATLKLVELIEEASSLSVKVEDKVEVIHDKLAQFRSKDDLSLLLFNKYEKSLNAGQSKLINQITDNVRSNGKIRDYAVAKMSVAEVLNNAPVEVLKKLVSDEHMVKGISEKSGKFTAGNIHDTFKEIEVSQKIKSPEDSMARTGGKL
jgi:hypothetical protein